MKKTFHVLIATIGKESICNQLDSLLNQLSPDDYLTIVFDNLDVDNVFDKVSKYPFSCNYNVIMEPQRLGSYGHGIRNKHNKLEGDFILHADDDDFYAEGAFDKIREVCTNEETLYIFQMDRYYGDEYQIIPNFDIIPIINHGNIGTPCGVIPSCINMDAIWHNGHGGDGSFYISLQNSSKHIEYIDTVIYHYNFRDCWKKRGIKK